MCLCRSLNHCAVQESAAYVLNDVCASAFSTAVALQIPLPGQPGDQSQSVDAVDHCSTATGLKANVVSALADT